jgi:hypothetical protein
MATPTTTTKNVYSASLVTIHSDRAFDDVLSSLYSQVGLPGSDQDEVGDHGFLMDQVTAFLATGRLPVSAFAN